MQGTQRHSSLRWKFIMSWLRCWEWAIFGSYSWTENVRSEFCNFMPFRGRKLIQCHDPNCSQHRRRLWQLGPRTSASNKSVPPSRAAIDTAVMNLARTASNDAASLLLVVTVAAGTLIINELLSYVQHSTQRSTADYLHKTIVNFFLLLRFRMQSATVLVSSNVI
jgi:hypothetical protein